MSSLITSLTDFIQNLYVVTGLVGIVLAMAIESCCIPLPSEIIMPLAGSMLAVSSASSAKHLLGVSSTSPLWLNLVLVALAGSLGSLVGSLAAYAIGYVGGRPLMLKYGKYVLISQHDADKADAFFQRWGTATAFFSRMLPVVRTYISLPAGITKMNAVKFSIYTFLGSLPWCLLLAYLGYQLGSHYEQISGPLHYLDGLIVVLVVVLVVLYVWRHIRNDRRARAEHAATESAQAQANNNPWSQPQPVFQGQGPQSQPFQMQGQQGPFQGQGSQPFQGQQAPFQGQGQQPQPFQGQQAPFQGQGQQPQPFQGQQQVPPSSPQQAWGQPQPTPSQWGQPQPAAQPWGQPPFAGQQVPPSSPQQAWGQPQPTPPQWGRPVTPSQPQPPQQGGNPGPGNGWQR